MANRMADRGGRNWLRQEFACWLHIRIPQGALGGGEKKKKLVSWPTARYSDLNDLVQYSFTSTFFFLSH